MTDGPLIGGAAFTGIVAFSRMICFLWSPGSGTLVENANGPPLAVRIFFIDGTALCFFGNGLLQIEYLRSVLIQTSADGDTHEQCWIFFCDGRQDFNGM